jgi:hypothetical protein
VAWEQVEEGGRECRGEEEEWDEAGAHGCGEEGALGSG